MNLTEAYATTAYLVMVYITQSLNVADRDKLNLQLVADHMMQARTAKPDDALRMLFSVSLDLYWGYGRPGFKAAIHDRMLMMHNKKAIGQLLDGVQTGTIVL